MNNTLTSDKLVDNINVNSKLGLGFISFDKLQNNFDLSKFSNQLANPN